jgi:carbon monoxide dehydrogenase subunit G
MLLAGKIRVQAPIQQVWDTLLEPETLQACLPGIEKVERLDEKHYAIVFMQKIGPLPLRFKIKATLTRVEPPLHLEIEGQRAETLKAGEARHKARIDLRETVDGFVEISYTADANMGGTLAIFGEGILQAKTKKIESEIAQALQQKLNGRV